MFGIKAKIPIAISFLLDVKIKDAHKLMVPFNFSMPPTLFLNPHDLLNLPFTDSASVKLYPPQDTFQQDFF